MSIEDMVTVQGDTMEELNKGMDIWRSRGFKELGCVINDFNFKKFSHVMEREIKIPDLEEIGSHVHRSILI